MTERTALVEIGIPRELAEGSPPGTLEKSVSGNKLGDLAVFFGFLQRPRYNPIIPAI
jgi:hypothetical protein